MFIYFGYPEVLCVWPAFSHKKVANKNMKFYTIFLYDHSSNFYDSCNLKIQTFYSTPNFWLTCIDFLIQYCPCHRISASFVYFYHSCMYRMSKLAKIDAKSKYQSNTGCIKLCDDSSIQL